MDLKKFISGISALSIAASAFAAVTITANAAEGDVSTLADVDFSDNVTTGITISGNDTTVPYETADDRLKIGKGSASVTIDDTSIGSTDKVNVSFKLGFGKLSKRSVYFNLKDGENNIIADFNYNVYSNTFSANTLGVDSGHFYHGYNTVLWDRAPIFNIELNYKTRKITTKTSGYSGNYDHGTVDMPDGAGALKTFLLGSDYSSNPERRCEIDDILITRTEGPAPESYDYSIKATSADGNVDVVLATGSAAEGDPYGATGLPKVISSNGSFYVIDPSVNNYSVSYFMGEDDGEKTITYVKDETIVAYAEGESFAKNSDNTVYSGGADGHASAATNNGARHSMGTFAAGVYQVEVVVTGNTNRAFVLRDKNVQDVRNCWLTNNLAGSTGKKTADFTLTKETNVDFGGTDNATSGGDYVRTGQTCEFDYYIVRRIGDVPTVAATLEEDNITDDTQYTGADAGATYSVFKATVTAGTNAITSLYFTLNNGAKSTDEYNETTITEGSSAIFGLIVPMASANVTDITAVIDGDSYVAFE
ncbi:MAG: hypothetical protein IJH37_04945 [Clostridia bacterium]|nr:hypothetical protein [Clostridia bacterium]